MPKPSGTIESKKKKAIIELEAVKNSNISCLNTRKRATKTPWFKNMQE